MANRAEGQAHDHTQAFHRTPRDYLVAEGPDDSVLFLSPEDAAGNRSGGSSMASTASFTYAGQRPTSWRGGSGQLLAAGIPGFDVAFGPPRSRWSARLVRGLVAALQQPPSARGPRLRWPVGNGVASWSVDAPGVNSRKLARAACHGGRKWRCASRCPSRGGAYDFRREIRRIAETGRRSARPVVNWAIALADLSPRHAMHRPRGWTAISTAPETSPGPRASRWSGLNVPVAAFPSRRSRAEAPPLDAIFDGIARTTIAAFGGHAPAFWYSSAERAALRWWLDAVSLFPCGASGGEVRRSY